MKLILACTSLFAILSTGTSSSVHFPVYSTHTDSAIESVEIDDPMTWAHAQETPMTCWAACNRMLLEKLDLKVSEQEQVLRMTAAMPNGGLSGAGAHFENAKVALGGIFKGADGKSQMVIPYIAYSTAYNPNDRQYFANAILINSLKKGIPAITATPQHAVIVYGATYSQTGSIVTIHSLKYIDPMPKRPLGGPSLGEVSGYQIGQLIGFMTARVEDVE